MALFTTKGAALDFMAEHGGTLHATRDLVNAGVPGINHGTADSYFWCVTL